MFLIIFQTNVLSSVAFIDSTDCKTGFRLVGAFVNISNLRTYFCVVDAALSSYFLEENLSLRTIF